MEIFYDGVDISTEEKFLAYVDNLNSRIREQHQVVNDQQEKLLDREYLLKRYKVIVARNKKRLFMAENDCYRCEYFQKLARKCHANCECEMEKTVAVTEGGDI